MAGRSLGSLTVDLVLKNGGFEAGMDKSARAAEKSLKRIQSTARGIGTAFAALAGFVSFRAIIAASAEAAKNFAQLENAVKNAGAAAGGRTARDFAAVSEELQNVSTFSDDAVQGVQQLLLRFQSIRTDRFDETTKAVLDMATAMGTDAESAAKLLGRALTDPEKGMTALARAGVVFSDSQKKVIKGLVDTGRQAEAQGIILDELRKKFGGAAEAARNNFAGALAGVKNAFDDLLEVDGGLPEATKQLNELSAVLSDPATKAGADALFGGIVVAATTAAAAVAKLAGGIREAFGGQTGNAAIDLTNDIRDLKFEIEAAQKRVDNNSWGVFGDSAEEASKKLVFLNQRLKETQQALEWLQERKANTGGPTPTGVAEVLPDITVTEEVAKSTEKVATAAARAREELVAMGQALTTSVQTPLEKYYETIAESDRLLAAGVITSETWTRANEAAVESLGGVTSGVVALNQEYENLIDTIESSLDDGLMQQFADENLKAIESGIESGNTEMLAKLETDIQGSTEKMSVYAEQAARNTQDIIADGLMNGFDGGIKGVLQSFGKMLQQMAAQAIAANIAEKLFGDPQEGSSGGGGGGWLGAIFSMFTASRDQGGRGQPGVAYAIGTGAQPEIFVPDSAGEFYPKGSGGGGMKLVQHFNFSAPTDRHTQTQVGAAAGRGVQNAQRRNG